MPYFVLTNNTASMALADLNGDGKLDLAAGLMVFTGNGDGTFQPPVSFGDARAVLAADSSPTDRCPAASPRSSTTAPATPPR